MLKNNLIIVIFPLLAVLIAFSACNYAAANLNIASTADIIDIGRDSNESVITDTGSPEELISGKVFESAYWCECKWCDGSAGSGFPILLRPASEAALGSASETTHLNFVAHVNSPGGSYLSPGIPDPTGGNPIRRYPVHFFENNYLVTFNLQQPTDALQYRVARVQSDGTIVLRRVSPSGRLRMISDWQIIIELDNSIMPDEFRVVFDPPARREAWYAEGITVQIIVSPDCLPPLAQSMADGLPRQIMDGVQDIVGDRTVLYITKYDNSLWRLFSHIQLFRDINSRPYWLDPSIYGGTMRKMLDYAGNFCMASRSAIMPNGDLWIWADNDAGTVPEKILSDIAEHRRYRNVSMAITANGDLYGWGRNEYGQLGNGKLICSDTPVKIMENVRDVLILRQIVLALTYDGSVYAWGKMNWLLQYDFWGIENVAGPPIYVLYPKRLMDNARAIYGNQTLSHTSVLIITNDNELLGFGHTVKNALRENSLELISAPVHILDNVDSVAIGAYFDGFAAITLEGCLWVWGNSRINRNATIPTRIMGNVEAVFLHSLATYALTSCGELWGWGIAMSEIPGSSPDRQDSERAEPLSLIIDNVMMAVPGLSPHFTVITNDNILWSWGLMGMLTAAGIAPCRAPFAIMEDVVYATNTFAITSDGTLWSWMPSGFTEPSR